MNKLLIMLILVIGVALSGCVDHIPTIQLQPVHKIVFYEGEMPVSAYDDATNEIYEHMPEYINGIDITSFDAWVNGCDLDYIINDELYAFGHDNVEDITQYRISNNSAPRFITTDDGEHLHIFVDLDTLKKYAMPQRACYPRRVVKI